MRIKLLIIGLLLTTHLFADGYYTESISQDQPWSIIASVGSGKYQHIHSNDARTFLGRLALNNDMILTGNFVLGLELGVQNAHHMHLDKPNIASSKLNWYPVSSSFRPMLDLLITAKSDPLGQSSVFAQLKGGVAYRSWQIDFEPLHKISQLAGEIQAGFGYPLTALSSLNLLYQGIFGSDPYVQLNTYKEISSISKIPILHAVLIGLSINL